MEGYLTPQQAADALGVTKGRVTQLIKSGQLEAEKFGGTWAIKEESVIARKESNPKAGNPNFGRGYNRWG